MEWLAQNWGWLLFFGVFIGIHVLGRGCHGKHKNKDNSSDHSH